MNLSDRCLVVRVLTLAILGTTTGFLGCGGGDGLNRQAVQGTVTVGGEKLKAGRIVFDPVGEGPAVSAGGAIVEGSYSISAAEGLPPGSYVARISSEAEAPPPPDPNEPPGPVKARPPVDPILPRYNVESELKAEVTKGGANVFDYTLDASKKKK